MKKKLILSLLINVLTIINAAEQATIDTLVDKQNRVLYNHEVRSLPFNFDLNDSRLSPIEQTHIQNPIAHSGRSIQDVIKEEGMPVIKKNKTLNLQGKRITSLVGLNTIENIQTVKHLDLSYNYIQRIDTTIFTDLVHLQNIDLSHNQIDYINAITFSTLINLQTLHINYNELKEDNVDDFCKQHKINTILYFTNQRSFTTN